MRATTVGVRVSVATVVAGLLVVAADATAMPDVTSGASTGVVADPMPSTSFRHVDAPVTWQTLSAGDVSTCGLATDGTAWCWGPNDDGVHGDSTTIKSRVPVRVLAG